MELSDLFYVDNITIEDGAVQDLDPISTLFTRGLVWAYRKPPLPVVKYSETREDVSLILQTKGDRIELDYFPMTDEEVSVNIRELFRFALSEEPDVRLVRADGLVPFFKESLKGLYAVGVDEAQKDLDLGVPTIVLPKFTVSTDRVVGIGMQHVGVVSKGRAGVGMFMVLGKTRSAYLR